MLLHTVYFNYYYWYKANIYYYF